MTVTVTMRHWHPAIMSESRPSGWRPGVAGESAGIENAILSVVLNLPVSLSPGPGRGSGGLRPRARAGAMMSLAALDRSVTVTVRITAAGHRDGYRECDYVLSLGHPS
jgi:hypothetical protein